MASEKIPRRLGRGLDALFNASPLTVPGEPETALRDIPIQNIRRNPFQPRKDFDPQQLKELQESLSTSGLLQPITVRPSPEGSQVYELIAGERRLRAAIELGWTTIAAVVKDLDDRQLLALALIENLQRTDLNPIEEGEGYHRLSHEFGLTQQQIAETVGKDRTTIANMLRLLQLPDVVRKLLEDGQLTMGHAKVLLGLEDPEMIATLAREIVSEGLTVREIERRLREFVGPRTGKKAGRPRSADRLPPEVKRLENRLRRFLQTDVTVSVGKNNRGTLTLHFYSTDDLERLLEVMRVPD